MLTCSSWYTTHKQCGDPNVTVSVVSPLHSGTFQPSRRRNQKSGIRCLQNAVQQNANTLFLIKQTEKWTTLQSMCNTAFQKQFHLQQTYNFNQLCLWGGSLFLSNKVLHKNAPVRFQPLISMEALEKWCGRRGFRIFTVKNNIHSANQWLFRNGLLIFTLLFHSPDKLLYTALCM